MALKKIHIVRVAEISDLSCGKNKFFGKRKIIEQCQALACAKVYV
jgi:hypothetical protein